jgi:hypothetical protein
MARLLMVGGLAAILVGVALLVPAGHAWLENGSLTELAIGVIVVGSTLIAGGLVAVVAGVRRWRELSMPSAVRAAVMANVLFLAFFALEISDGLVRRGGAIHPISCALFAPALLLLYGLLSARRWAWWVSRGVAGVFTLWFVGFVAVIPFADLRGEQGPVPWWGRVYMACVSLALAGILAGAFLSLGRSTARNYFGFLQTKENAVAS